MTTLALLKADLARILGTSSRTTQIAAAINRAITKHQSNDWWFNESRSYTFNTVVGQVYYSGADSANITAIRNIEGMVLEQVGNHDIPLSPMNIIELEYLTDDNSSQGEPTNYSYYDSKVALYPKPDAVYTVRMFGTFALAAPASDSEADNAWMTEAYNLIKATSLIELFGDMRNMKAAEGAGVLERRELRDLTNQSTRRRRTGYVKVPKF